MINCKMSYLRFGKILFISSLLTGLILSTQLIANGQSAIATEEYATEKVYLHTDRSFYICGEIMWFKAYVVNAENNKLFRVSKVLYVELIDRKKEPVLQQKISLSEGQGVGSVLLPFSLATGNYEIRAYTNWMKNETAENFFRKKISVVNTTKNLDTALIHPHPINSMSFFPEGGSMVNGLVSKIAFHVTNNFGQELEGRGVVVDRNGDTITRFNTSHAGTGHFLLTPTSGESYTAVFVARDGSEIRRQLPAASDNGYVMQVADTANNLVKVSVDAVGAGKSRGVYLAFQNNHRIILAKSQHLENGAATVLVPRDSLEDGVMRVTVFDDNRMPVCERLYFKRPQRKLVIKPVLGSNTYGLREQVEVDITTTNGNGQPLPGHFSVSVFRLDQLHQPEDRNISTDFWLPSWPQGLPEDLEYLMSEQNAETDAALEDLLLTRGWKTFSRDTSASQNPQPFAYLPEYDGHIITGRVTSEATGRPARDVLVYLSVPGRSVQLKGCRSDENGYIKFEMKDFIGPSQIVLQTGADKNGPYRINILSPFSGAFSLDAIPELRFSAGDEEALRRDNFAMEVQNGYHRKRLDSLKAATVSTPFYFTPHKTYLLDNYTRFTTMEEVMREYVNEVGVRRRGGDFTLMTVNQPGFELQSKQPVEQFLKDDPLILLDGVPVFNVNKIMAYDPFKIQKLEVVAARYYWGPIVADGILSYTTYRGNLEGYTLDPGDIVLDYDGLQRQRIFYSPDYSSAETLQSPLPDYRRLLFWSPSVSTDSTGKGKFSFYTGDLPGKYLVEVQGIGPDGEVASARATFDVMK